jgi:hypothetical protein
MADKRGAKTTESAADRREFIHGFLALADKHTDETRLAWLLNFAQRQGLASLRDEALLRLQQEVVAFSIWAVDAVDTTDHERLSAEQLSLLSEKISGGIRAVVNGDSGEGWETPKGSRVSRAIYKDPGGTVRVVFHTDSPTLVIWKAQSLIAQYRDRILHCKRPGCGRWFLRVRRQRFCSEACSLSYRKNAWRQNPANRSKELARQRTRYAELIAEKQGRPVAAVREYRNRKGVQHHGKSHPR